PFEIEALMTFLKEYLRKELENIHRNNIRFQTIGRTNELDESVQFELRSAIRKTANNTGMVLNVALNYGGGGGKDYAVPQADGEMPSRRPLARNNHRKRDRAASVHRRSARSRSIDPHQRRDAREQFPVVADRLLGNLRDGDAVA